MMNKATLASVALLTEAEAARVFNMGTTRFKARCVTKPDVFLPPPSYVRAYAADRMRSYF